jgi:hypothetical protein
MSRSTQFIGLSDRAKAFIADNQLQVVSSDDEETIDGMFGEPVHTIQYYYVGGHLAYKEYIQAEPWFSGPMIFLALWDIDNDCPVVETLWSDEEFAAEGV